MLHTFSSIIPSLCRGERSLTDQWMQQSPAKMLAYTLPLILLGAGSYGLSMGLWQGWEMALYAGIKFPLVVIATLIVNAVINSMLAMVLGSGITIRQTLQFLFSAFAICAIILGSLSPIMIGMALQGPALGSDGASNFYSNTLVSHVLLISYAGIVSHSMLLGSLRQYASSRSSANKTFIAWLAGNLFVGAQIGWISRPFFGTPGGKTEFFREDKFSSSFYEAVLNSLQNIF